jgi:AdoMet-dependent heme synthase
MCATQRRPSIASENVVRTLLLQVQRGALTRAKRLTKLDKLVKKFRVESIYQKARDKRIPLVGHFDLTYRCHQRCLHCYIPRSWRSGTGPGPEFDTDQVKKVLDECAAAGTFFLVFSGGEVFLRPDLFEILEYARRLNFSISLYTSGTYGLNKDIMRKLREVGILGIYMSLYSLEARVHDQITQRQGSWDLAWRAAQDCRAQGLRVVFNCLALSLNYSGILALKQVSAQEGIPLRLDFNLTPRWDGQAHLPGLALDPEVTERLMEELGLKGRLPDKPCPTTLEGKESRECGAGQCSYYVSPLGEIRPCIDIVWNWGCINNGTRFSAIWNDSKMLNRLAAMERQQMFYPGERLCDYIIKNQITFSPLLYERRGEQ